MTTCTVSSLFCSLTFARLTSNTIHLFLSIWQPLYPVNPYLTGVLTDQGSGQGCKVNRETDYISECKKSDILWFAQCSIFFFAFPNADVFTSLLFPPAVTSLMGIIHLPDISPGRHTCKHTVLFASYPLGVHTSSSRSCK